MRAVSHDGQGRAVDGEQRRSRSVERALTLLLAVAQHREPIGVSELARQTELSKSTVHLSLQTMRQFGFVEQEDGSDRYLLGLQAAQLGAQALDISPVVSWVAPGMRRLAERSGEAVSLGIRADRAVVFVKRYETSHRLGTSITVGSQMPMHASASGKCLLSGLSDQEIEELYPDDELPSQSTNTIRDRSALFEELDEVRARGHAFNTDEFVDGISAAAVPVHLGDRVVAALSIAGPTTRFQAEDWLIDLHEVLDPRGAQVGGAQTSPTGHPTEEVGNP